MGNINDKLTYLNTTKGLIKKGLNNLGSELTNEPFRDYADSLDDIYDKFPKVHGVGVDIKLPTIKGKMLVGVSGGTRQQQLLGSNKLDEETIKNTTFSEGTYKYALTNIQGSTLYFKAALKEGKTAINGIYVSISSNGANPNIGTSIFSIRNGSITTESTDFTNVSNIYFSVYPKTVSIQELFETYNFWVSDTDTTYEEYCGGQVSPNPSYPQLLEIPKGNIIIEKNNKNFFDIDEINNLALSSKFVQNSSYRGFTMRVRPGQTYTISRADIEVPNRFRVCFSKELPKAQGIFYNSSGREGAYNNLDSVLEGTITVPEEMNYMFLYLSNIAQTISDSMQIQIELNDVKTEWVAGNHNTIIFTLNENQPLMENSYLANDGIHNSFGYHVLTGEEAWEILGETSTYIQMSIRRSILDGAKIRGEVLSNYFTQTKNDRAEFNNIYIGNNYLNICIDRNIASTVEEFKSWLATNLLNDNPVVIQYELTTEQVQPYTETQQEQFEQIDNMMSYDGYTNIQAYSDDLAPILDITAITSGVNTSEANATAGDILLGKTAYVGTEKLTGTIGKETKVVKSTTQSQTITPTTGNLIEEVTVEPIILEEVNITPSTQSQVITPATGKDGINQVNVDAIQLQNKSVTIIENGTSTITPDTGYDGLDEVEIDVEVVGPPKVVDGMKLAKSTSIPNNLDTSEVTDMQYMFYQSTFTTIPLIDVSNSINTSSMFENCSKLTTIPLIDTSNSTAFGGMFSNCSKLTSIPLIDTSKGTNFNRMFHFCSALTSVPQIDMSNSTYCQNVFSYCTNLVDVPVFNGHKITNMGLINNMFEGCSKLSNESLNNIMAFCISTNVPSNLPNRTLKYIGLSSTQATTCQTLSNWEALSEKGWRTGY